MSEEPVLNRLQDRIFKLKQERTTLRGRIVDLEHEVEQLVEKADRLEVDNKRLESELWEKLS